jgi:hypothetical protein
MNIKEAKDPATKASRLVELSREKDKTILEAVAKAKSRYGRGRGALGDLTWES